MENLNALLDLLTENTNIHICITDMSGILNNPSFKISSKYHTHSKPFCDTAKMTQKGFNLCMHCKGVCNKRAVLKKQPFSGLCAFGMYEIVYPVEINETVPCIIYIGNMVCDSEKSLKKLNSASKNTSGNISILQEHLSNAYHITCADKYFTMAEIISDYIKLLYKNSPVVHQQYHWAVNTAMHYAELNYYHPLSLKSIADSCFINEKYLGRIFKMQTGYTFHEYLTNIRLERAAFLLKHSELNILQTALDSGFNSPSYFNRAFSKKYNMSPKIYKKTYFTK